MGHLEVLVQVRVDQAGIGACDPRPAVLLSVNVIYLRLKLTHELGCLNKLVFVVISQLSELVNILGWPNLEWHLHCKRLIHDR